MGARKLKKLKNPRIVVSWTDAYKSDPAEFMVALWADHTDECLQFYTAEAPNAAVDIDAYCIPLIKELLNEFNLKMGDVIIKWNC